MKDTNYVQVERGNWEVLITIVTRILLERADEHGYASLGKLSDSCVGVMDPDYSTRNEEESSGIHLTTREYLLSLDQPEEYVELFSTAPYWIEVVGAHSDPEPITGANDGYLYRYVSSLMEGY